MTEYCMIGADGVFDLLGRAMKKRAVMGPKEREDQPGFHYFGWLTSPEEFISGYITTTIPPKKAFFPPSQILFSYELSRPPILVDAAEHSEFVLAGVHPCDLAAIDELDDAYGYPPADGRWQRDRRRGIIIGIDCKPDEYCFCATVGACSARKPCDLFLTQVERGYLVEVITAAGKGLLDGLTIFAATDRDMRDAHDWLEEKRRLTSGKLAVSIPEFADILEEGGLTAVWQDVANRCYSCGSCNTTCPTCFCFDIADELELNMKCGIRRRTWDSCQLLEFALIAGPHNFREDRWQRVRHRWHRKFLYLFRKYGRPYCTGCGRCSRACTADINIVDVSNQLIAHARREALKS
jgi:sulfhydrogenase subunit beta (sulfur reductase)